MYCGGSDQEQLEVYLSVVDREAVDREDTQQELRLHVLVTSYQCS